jgi:hypothetical protein
MSEDRDGFYSCRYHAYYDSFLVDYVERLPHDVPVYIPLLVYAYSDEVECLDIPLGDVLDHQTPTYSAMDVDGFRPNPLEKLPR